MFNRIFCKFIIRCLLLNCSFVLYALTSTPSQAEIIPEQTLPNNSVVPPNCINCEITGGTKVGNNLFHSFEKFSIPTNGVAHFQNSADIQNIITRVTGQSPSIIDGLIRTNDAANLFLINPNGIVLGYNATLDVSGSFIATTANRIRFADGTEFLATPNQVNPLLTISVPVGLGFGEVPGKIINQAIALDPFEFPLGLQVPSHKTLALIGGEIALDGGFLTTPGGRIELGSVSGNSFVNLIPTDKGWTFGYEGVQNFQDITLSKAAFVGSSDFLGADIQMQGKRIIITEGSQVSSVADFDGQAANVNILASEQLELIATTQDFFPTGIFNEVDGDVTGEGKTLTIATPNLIVQGGAQISTTTYGAGRGIDLSVKASESIQLVGNSPVFDIPSGLFARVNSQATGDGGVLTIETGNLLVQGGAQISAATFGAGNAGELKVTASKSITVEGRTPDDLIGSGLFAQVEEDATGDGGNLTINTQKLNVLSGAQISTSARSGGKGGLLTINATDYILVSGIGAIADDFSRSNILVSAESGAIRDGGALQITTPTLTVENGGRISADNFGSAKGGIATLDVKKLLIRNGGEVRAGSFSQGDGGTLNVNATESVDVVGIANIGGKETPSTLFSQAQDSGKAGNLIITTPTFNVSDGALVTVSAIGTGEAGNLTATANIIRLNQGKLTAETNAGAGANIRLEDVKLLVLQNQSLISAQAFNNGNGGNITIDAPDGFIVATANQNNDIVANAFQGRGGNININARSIFNLEQRPSLPPNNTNDIDASSQFGLTGTVTINTPDVDPSRGLVQLPSNLTDASQQIVSSCNPGSAARRSSFTVTGRGGIARSPIEPFQGDVSTARWITLDTVDADQNSNVMNESPPSSPAKIVEAQGWIVDKNGNVSLVAQVPNTTPRGSSVSSGTCS
ncbi:two-partner secretion domain-containing protein [Nostoc sp. UHCC 0870]|uniref:two-partner secretion domain-containing protein n=1 Tax=Nostoc sp. UHCC 0870 TaxID=2914041 RepID=UPI001EDE3FEF|nr:S-layer family protein [Nostoc sp. UHCC 0870]UKP00494.1 S-layer family protein [Nostoc sp. UHCC 0870]